MEEKILSIYEEVGGYRVTFKYYLMTDVVKSKPYFPIYCRVTFLRKTTKFRSLALNDFYKSLDEDPNYSEILDQEAKSIVSCIMSAPVNGQDTILRAVSMYLDNNSPYRGRIMGLRKLYNKLHRDLISGEDLDVSLNRFDTSVRSLMA